MSAFSPDQGQAGPRRFRRSADQSASIAIWLTVSRPCFGASAWMMSRLRSAARRDPQNCPWRHPLEQARQIGVETRAIGREQQHHVGFRHVSTGLAGANRLIQRGRRADHREPAIALDLQTFGDRLVGQRRPLLPRDRAMHAVVDIGEFDRLLKAQVSLRIAIGIGSSHLHGPRNNLRRH
jgi:hypothetical protein